MNALRRPWVQCAVLLVAVGVATRLLLPHGAATPDVGTASGAPRREIVPIPRTARVTIRGLAPAMAEKEVFGKSHLGPVEYWTEIGPYHELSLRSPSRGFIQSDNALDYDDQRSTFHDGSVAEPVVYVQGDRIVSVSGSCLEFEGRRVIGQSCTPSELRTVLSNFTRRELPQPDPHEFTAVYPDLGLYVDEHPHEGIWAWSFYYNGPNKTNIWLSLGGIDETRADVSRTPLLTQGKPTGGRLFRGPGFGP